MALHRPHPHRRNPHLNDGVPRRWIRGRAIQRNPHTRLQPLTERGPRLTTKVITLREAKAFVERHHRHHRSPVGHKLSIGVRIKGTDDLVGVAIVSRPVARRLDDGGDTLEVSRTCTDGTRNANSALYGAVWRICRELGARRIITYTQQGESGASLRAAGFVAVAHRKPNDGWDRQARARESTSPTNVWRTLWLRGEPLPICHETVAEDHETIRPAHCSQCHRALPQPKTGRPRRTCSDTCRQRARRKRRASQPEAVTVDEAPSGVTLFAQPPSSRTTTATSTEPGWTRQ